MCDEKLLADSLKEMGFQIETHSEPVTMYGWHGETRPEKATVIIRRHHTGIGASNDVGFVKGPDGKITAIISDYDRASKFNDSWLGKLRQEYGVQEHLRIGRQKGYVFSGRETIGNKVRLRFTVR